MAIRRYVDEFLAVKMMSFLHFLWFSMSSLLHLMKLLTLYAFSFRFNADKFYKKDGSNCSTVFHPAISKDWESDEPEEKAIPKFSFQFRHQDLQTQRGNEESDGSLATERKPPTTSTSKYEFMPEKDFCGFLEELEVLSLSVKELYEDSNFGSFSNKEIIDEGFKSENALLQLDSVATTIREEIVEDEAINFHSETEETWKTEDLQTESTEEFSFQNHPIDPKEGFLFDSLLQKLSQTKIGPEEENLEMAAEIQIPQNSTSTPAADKSEETHLLNSRMVDIGIHYEADIDEDDDDEEEDEKNRDFAMGNDGSATIAEASGKNLQKLKLPEPEDRNELEKQWEHQNLMEQLKMELRKVRVSGLPTIIEESKSPNVREALKPWKIDEKLFHEDQMDELNKFYMSYTQQMRKLDIFNYQKMYAIGFLQSKDPLDSISNRKSSYPAISSIISQNFWISKFKRTKLDPTVKFIGELLSDLEMVYVGQMCLSWEILHWQYIKAQELQESYTDGIHRYSHVAGQFQQFQVLTQRFLEYEAFQGPRVQNYVKNRCVLRSLIQVPLIKEDPRDGDGDGNGMTIAMLVEIIEKSMQIFWEFVRADKEEANMILKGLWRSQVELQNPADLDLLTEIRTNIQKKEKKLKDILRTGNCIVKRFQKRQRDMSDLILLFSQVDMKLISRVLNMSRVTSEQLVWCQKKLNKLNFVDRKIHREPSFLLFPC